VLKENGVHPGSVGKGHDKKSDVTDQTDEMGKHGGKLTVKGESAVSIGNGKSAWR
jgi:hypothetical protein